MKAKKKYYLIFICFISIAITNISITTSSNSNFNIVLNNLEAIASSGEGSGPSLKKNFLVLPEKQEIQKIFIYL